MTHQPTQAFAEELKDLREVIHHARKVGAHETLISIDLLAVLLAQHDATVASQTATAPLAGYENQREH